MKKQSAGAMLFFLAFSWAGCNSVSAQGSGELDPGWSSLDSTVGKLDSAIQKGKSTVEEYTFGVKISDFLDTSYTVSGNHPGSGSSNNISQRVFDIDNNQIVFNDFNLILERPEPEKG